MPHLQPLELLSPLSQSSKFIRVSAILSLTIFVVISAEKLELHLVGLKHGEVDPGHIVVLGLDLDLCFIDILEHGLVEISSSSKLGLGQGKGSFLNK